MQMSRPAPHARHPTVKPGTSMLTGFETALAKTAASGAVRATSPVKNILARSLVRRRLRQELASGSSASETDAFLSTLNPDIAQELVRFIASAELRNLAMNLSADFLLGRFGKSTNKISKELKAQLRSLLAWRRWLLQ
jgi:hypothetical protein